MFRSVHSAEPESNVNIWWCADIFLNAQVIIIQKYYRRWLAKRYVNIVRENETRRREWERQEEMNKVKEKEGRIKREFERRMNPKSKEDFDLLYHALESMSGVHC